MNKWYKIEEVVYPYEKADYYVYFNSESNFIINTINNYINEHRLSVKKFSEDNNLSYNSLLNYLSGKWVRSIEGCLSFLSHRIITEKEKLINRENIGFDLSDFEIDIIKCFCKLLINNDKDKIRVEGTNDESVYLDVIRFFNDNNVDIKISYSWSGRGDHDPYVEFKVDSFENENLGNILKRVSEV